MDKTGACSLKGSASPLSEEDVPVLPAQAKDDDGQQAECGLPWNPIRWGFLILSAEKGHWDIDLAQLELHIQEMRLQLDATASIMSWVRVWNSYMNSFFVNNFGKPAKCLGTDHIRICMLSFEMAQQRLLQVDGGRHHNLTDMVRTMIEERFGHRQGVPASLVYFPAELGGLALHNPLVELSTKMLVKTQDTPREIVQKAWYGARQRFDRLVERWDQAMLRRKSRGFEADEDKTFMTFQSFVRYAEETEPALCSAYSTLLEDLKGAEEDIGVELIFDDQRVDGWLAYQRAATKSRTPFYWKRIVQLYGAEALEYYGTLNMAQAGSLPMGVTGYLSSEKIRWQN